MCDQIIIDAKAVNKRPKTAPEIHKIHTAVPPSIAIGATPQPYSTLVSQWFGLGNSKHQPPPILQRTKLPCISPGQIILITGPSGSGKSTLLRRFRRSFKIPIINIPRIPLSQKSVIDHFAHISIESALAHLSRVGLAEAHCYLLPPRYLSDGQRWRLRLALALCATGGLSASVLFCDEFTSMLDPISASIVARVLRRAIGPGSNLFGILACSRTDILRALSPDLIIRCDFGSLQFWKKKGENYALARETSQTPKLHSRPPHPRPRHPRRL